MNIWQTKKWWEMLINSNQAEKIIEVDWLQIEKRKISFWKKWLFIIWIEESDINKVNKNLEQLKNLCKKEKSLFIQIETINYNWIENQNIKWFKNSYYKKFITPYTAIIDLEKDEETILKEMKPKGRYNIKLAWKKWVVVKEVEKNKENIKQYYQLMNETTWRKWFSWNNLNYYIKFLEQLKNSKLLLAYFEDKVIAWWIFIFDKEVSIYYYWASTSDNKYRNLMAPFLLQWEAIKIAKNQWTKIYDFLWITNPEDKKSSLVWVTAFKMKLTKDKINVSDGYIYINNKIIYWLIKLLRKLKWL
jgi:lipid II:glycine glycyltransferase (peptidoglycan interpeptide bridge formation enzyme)